MENFMDSVEARLAALETLQQEQHGLYILLINLILRSDDQLRLRTAEAIRLLLQNPVERHPVSDILRSQLRLLRDELLREPIPELVEAALKPPIRPV